MDDLEVETTLFRADVQLVAPSPHQLDALVSHFQTLVKTTHELSVTSPVDDEQADAMTRNIFTPFVFLSVFFLFPVWRTVECPSLFAKCHG